MFMVAIAFTLPFFRKRNNSPLSTSSRSHLFRIARFLSLEASVG